MVGYKARISNREDVRNLACHRLRASSRPMSYVTGRGNSTRKPTAARNEGAERALLLQARVSFVSTGQRYPQSEQTWPISELSQDCLGKVLSPGNFNTTHGYV